MKRIHVIYGQGELDITCSFSISGPQYLNQIPDDVRKILEKKNTKRVTIEYNTDIPELDGFIIYTRMKDEE